MYSGDQTELQFWDSVFFNLVQQGKDVASASSEANSALAARRTAFPSAPASASGN